LLKETEIKGSMEIRFHNSYQVESHMPLKREKNIVEQNPAEQEGGGEQKEPLCVAQALHITSIWIRFSFFKVSA